MNYQSMSIDRREAYYQRTAALIAQDPLDFYTRAERGRKVQSNIKPKDLKVVKAGLNMSQLIKDLISYQMKHNPPKIVYQDHSTRIYEYNVQGAPIDPCARPESLK